MENLLSGYDVPKINLYAGHDITLAHIMRTLGVVDTVKPDFGAYLVVELYSNASVKVNVFCRKTFFVIQIITYLFSYFSR